MAAIFRTSRSTAAHWLALLAGLMMAISPANLLAQCGCGVCPCGPGLAAEATACCCQPSSSKSCCTAQSDNPQADCQLAGNCQCELQRSQQPAESRDARPQSPRGEFASTVGATIAADIPSAQPPSDAAIESWLLPARPPARILFCVWRN